MRTPSGRAAVTALALALVVSAADAQPSSKQPQDGWITGRLEEGDLADDGRLFDIYIVFGQAGARVTIDLESSDFDAYLFMSGIHATEAVPDLEDDDGGTGLNAQITTTLLANSIYAVKATTIASQAGRGGAYRIRLTGHPDVRLFGPIVYLPANEAWHGRLSDGDIVLGDGSVSDEYLHLTDEPRPARITFVVESSDFSPYISVMPPGGTAVSNDARGGREARVTVPGDGWNYLAAVSSSGSGRQLGRYTVRAIHEGRAASASPGQNPAGGPERFDGRLGPGSPTRSGGAYYRAHAFQGRRGERVAVILESDDFDAFLYVTGPDGFADHNDDADGRNARLEITLPADGTYYAVATSYGSTAATGAYRLKIQRR